MNNQLYAITAPGNNRCLTEQVVSAIKGGCRLFQYRDKSNDISKRLQEASQLSELCLEHNCNLIINDDVALAQTVSAAGVHLGQGDTPLEKARNILGEQAIIGITCHNSILLAQKAQQQGANYVAFGRFFSSSTKPDASQAPLPLLQEARSLISIPIVAIGGITLQNAPSVLQAGADILAVSHSLFQSDNIQSQAEQFCELFQSEK